ncbi:MAG: hypothetical protein ACKE51_00460 [Methylococcaceae bacterium]
MSNALLQEAFPEMQTEIKQAQRLTQQGDLIQAEEIYHTVLKQQVNFPPALYGLAGLAEKIDEQEVQEDLLRRAIAQIKDSDDRNKKGLEAIWLTELAEILIKQGRQNDAKQCINESERVIRENLTKD